MGKGGSGPRRSCVHCRKTQEKRTLLRIVASPEGSWIVDWRQRLPGRGAYLCTEPACVAGAMKRGSLRAALSTNGRDEEGDLMSLVREGVGSRVLRMVGMAARSAKLTKGRDETREALTRGRAFITIMAGDASDRTKRYFRTICARQGVNLFELFDKNVLGKATSRSELAVLAILDRQLAEKIGLDTRMYLRFAAGGGIHV